jgi:hypothetical protein
MPSSSVQAGPIIFQFQARVAAARLPGGAAEVTLPGLSLQLRAAPELPVLCQEDFADVLVQDGVLNLEVGRRLSCSLPEVLAQHDSLSVQVCIGGGGGCLAAVPMATVPYAVKGDYAVRAGSARRAVTAKASNLALRASADRDPFGRASIGDGYFDFRSFPPQHADTLFEAKAGDGFVAWTAVSGWDQPSRLHLSAADSNTLQSGPLETLHWSAEESTVTGRASVTGAGQVGGSASVLGGQVSASGDSLVVAGGATLQQSGHSKGDLDIQGTLTGLGEQQWEAGGNRLQLRSDAVSLVAGRDATAPSSKVNAGGLVATAGKLVAKGGLQSDLVTTLVGQVSVGKAEGGSRDTLSVHAPATLAASTFSSKLTIDRGTIALDSARTAVGTGGGRRSTFAPPRRSRLRWRSPLRSSWSSSM